MPIRVCLQTESAVVLADVLDAHDAVVALAQAVGHYALVIAHTIDPYGDTMFNRLQVPLLVRDIDLMKSYASNDQLLVLDEVKKLAERVSGEPHLYLKFVGD